MSNIWSAIIPENEKAVEMYLTEIMSDIIVNLNSAMWRNRQSRLVVYGHTKWIRVMFISSN